MTAYLKDHRPAPVVAAEAHLVQNSELAIGGGRSTESMMDEMLAILRELRDRDSGPRQVSSVNMPSVAIVRKLALRGLDDIGHPDELVDVKVQASSSAKFLASIDIVIQREVSDVDALHIQSHIKSFYKCVYVSVYDVNGNMPPF